MMMVYDSGATLFQLPLQWVLWLLLVSAGKCLYQCGNNDCNVDYLSNVSTWAPSTIAKHTDDIVDDNNHQPHTLRPPHFTNIEQVLNTRESLTSTLGELV